MKKKGFTLIELLVVIAIIGILASIVMVSMGGARDKARDARLKGDLSQVRTLAELIYDDLDTYASTCASVTSLGASGTNYSTQLGVIQADITAQTGTTTCQADADSYCINVELVSTLTNKYYCISSDGAAGATSGTCTSADITCSP